MNDDMQPDQPTATPLSDDEFERIARAASTALRRPAPADGMERLDRVRRKRRVGRSIVAGTIVLVGVIGAIVFGSRDEPAASSSATTTGVDDTAVVTADPARSRAQIQAAARGYADAILHGTTAEVNAFFSSLCTDPMTDTALAEVRTHVERSTGTPIGSVAIAGVDVRNVSAVDGEASVMFNLPAVFQGNDNWILYRLERGRWRVASCNQLPFGGNSSSSTSTDSSFSARIELPVVIASAGTDLQGFLVVTNNTGAPLHVLDRGCAPKWTVVLTNEAVPANVAFPADCATKPLEFPVGETRLPVTVYATYLQCTASTGTQPVSGFVQCLPSDRPPPLPAGEYTAVLVGSIPGLVPPQPVPVTLTS